MMHAEHATRRPIHSFEVGRRCQPEAAGRVQGPSLCTDMVSVAALTGIESCMESIRGELKRENSYGDRQDAVQRPQEPGFIHGVRRREVRYLAPGVYPGICAARSDKGSAPAQRRPEGLFEGLLDGGDSGLALPPGKRCAVILDQQPVGQLRHRASVNDVLPAQPLFYRVNHEGVQPVTRAVCDPAGRLGRAGRLPSAGDDQVEFQ